MTPVGLIFVDTSGLYALVDRSDRHHGEAVAIAGSLNESGATPFTTNYIVAETHALVLARLGHGVARKWLREFSVRTDQVAEADQSAACAIVLEQTDKDYSLTDAASFSVMRRLGVHRAFAFDSHFRQFGFEVLEADS